jgi:predicted nucleic acid-binding protein
MAVFLLDSSAVVKRYLTETGTAWVNALVHPAAKNRIFLVRIAGAEVVSAITRKSRGGGLSGSLASAALAQFRAEFGSPAFYNLIEVDATLITGAMRLASLHGLRGYDAVQLAGASEVHQVSRAARVQMSLISADAELNAAAAAEGLQVDNPNHHP